MGDSATESGDGGYVKPECSSGMAEQPLKNGLLLKKRKLAEETGAAKRRKLVKESETSLVMFPDDVLLIILSHLEHGSLIRLKDTCTLFARLCEDYTLWRKVNFSEFSATEKDLEDVSNLVHKETKHIRVLGKYVDKDTLEDTISQDWLFKIRNTCPNLETFALPNHFINCQHISINAFPPLITCLDLSNTRLRNLPDDRSYFKDISMLMPNLRSLILSNCNWFQPHSLMAISKCKNLEELRLNDCVQVQDCLAYCGLSTRGGFRALKTLDLRRCMVTASELSCFSSVPTLTNLFLENTLDENGEYTAVSIDQTIAVLCTKNNQMQLNAQRARVIADRPDIQIESLTVRHFEAVTDFILLKLARDAHNLKFLDVTGTRVTKDGVDSFRSLRPTVTLIHDVMVAYEE